MYGNFRFFTCVLTGFQLRGEGIILTSFHATQCGVQALDQVAGADLVGHRLYLGILNLFTVDFGRQVDHSEVIGLQLTLGFLQLTETVTQLVNLLFGCLIQRLQWSNGYLELGEVRYLNIWLDINLCGEFHEVVVFNLLDINLRLTDWVDVVFFHGLFVLDRQHVVDDLLEHWATTETRVDQLTRGFTLTETWDSHLLRDGLVGCVDFLIKLREWDIHGELHAGIAQLVDGCLHE